MDQDMDMVKLSKGKARVLVLARVRRRPPCRPVAFLVGVIHAMLIVGASHAFRSQPALPRRTGLRSTGGDGPTGAADALYFDIAIPTPAETFPLGRLTFRLTPEDDPGYLPLHASNLIALASGERRSVDPKATYEGCSFQYSPATIEDGSYRYRWGHVCEGNGRNGIRTASASGDLTSYDEPFADPQRIKECAHGCYGGVYYGRSYEDIADVLSKSDDGGDNAAVLLTVPIHGPGAGTSKFSIVRVGESPQEWGQRLLLNSAVVGYLDSGAVGTFGGDSTDSESDGTDGVPTALDVLRAMARQRVGPPKIVSCGVSAS